MQREIKFRGQTIAGELVFGLLALKDGEYYISNSTGSPFAYKIRPETIGQFTGLKDKNGTEVYEGDIVQLKNNRCYVEWRDCGFSLRRDGPDAKPWEYNGNLKGYCEGLWGGPPEIIGNLFENSELLK